MDTPLPTNEALVAYSQSLPWDTVESYRERFIAAIRRLVVEGHNGPPPLDLLSDALGTPVRIYYPDHRAEQAQVYLAEHGGVECMLGSVVSQRYRGGRSLLDSIVPYNLNPAVHHQNIDETHDQQRGMRPLGAEVELGLVHTQGESPSEDEMQQFIRLYYDQAQGLGIYPRLDREACVYQIEAHVAPSLSYAQTREALSGMMTALAAACEETGLRMAPMSCYPTLSDFKISDDPKIQSAVDLMLDVNSQVPEYAQRLDEVRQRYHMPSDSHHVEVFRIQGVHIHLDLAGRSEALGLLTFYTMLHSATAVANMAVLKGGPFVNGTCDAERLCVREYIRQSSITGRYVDSPLSPHLRPGDMDKFAGLLATERVNSTARALLYNDDTPGFPVAAMHNPIGRLRPDLATGKRICTLESTGMPANPSVSRIAAVLTDFAFSHMMIENYFRQYGCDLEPMYADQDMWAVLGPLDRASFESMQSRSDLEGSDLVLTTAAGTQMPLAEFYERKRLYAHKALADTMGITPRDIDDVYTSLNRMLAPPSGNTAQTVAQYISDPKLRSTGNWGQILRNAFVEAGGTPGSHNPDAVLAVVNQLHEAIKSRYQLEPVI